MIFRISLYLGKCLRWDPELDEKYNNEINNLLKDGYAEQVNLRKPDKFRVVYYCAAKHGQVSLNNEVYQGPDLTNNMLGVLVQFRENSVAMMVDIKGIFIQVKVPPDLCDCLSFRWWNDGDVGNLLVTHMTSVHLLRGVCSFSCSAYALLRTTVINTRQGFFLL